MPSIILTVIRSIVHSLRCVLVAMLAIALVSARPAMMASHAMPGVAHGCGMAMPSHHPAHTGHGCSITTERSCCDDCMCACSIGAAARKPVVVLVASFARVATTIEHPREVVRSRRQPALRLPPPLGPPLITRS